MRKMVNLQFPRKVESDIYLGQVMECLFGRLQRDIIVAWAHQEIWIPWGIMLCHINQCRNEKGYIDAMVIIIKLDNNFGAILISHEESIYALREKGRVYGRRKITSICVGTGAQWFLPFLGVDYVKFLSTDDKVRECNCVRDVLVLLSGNNRMCNKAHVDEAGDDPYGILIL